MKPISAIGQHLRSRAFWAGFLSGFSLDITGRSQGRMMAEAFGTSRRRIAATREVLERTDEEALAADRAALASDWNAIAKDFPNLPKSMRNPFD